KELQAVWPDKPVSKVWTGDVVAEPMTFRVAGPPPSDVPPKPRELAFGPLESGLQAAVEFRSADDSAQAQRDNAANTFPHGSRLDVRLHVKNVSDHEISFWSETWRQGDAVTIIDPAGKETKPQGAFYSGWPRMEHWVLKPDQVAILTTISL